MTDPAPDVGPLAGPWRPPDLRTAPIFVCATPRSRSTTIMHTHCLSCGWWASPADDDGKPAPTPSLFDEGPHSAQECAARQADPDAARRADLARFTDAVVAVRERRSQLPYDQG
jgi:hypothetical protein